MVDAVQQVELSIVAVGFQLANKTMTACPMTQWIFIHPWIILHRFKIGLCCHFVLFSVGEFVLNEMHVRRLEVYFLRQVVIESKSRN